jgi:hypothetical protein
MLDLPNGNASDHGYTWTVLKTWQIGSNSDSIGLDGFGAMGAIHQNYRDRPSNGQDRNGPSRLQHQTLYLLRKIAVA